ncbi:MAG: DUF1868 domain-containing protein [Legionellaceae bacterium]|nr:DUF1868 domain-containing protein [Legionellaceae bacterium]
MRYHKIDSNGQYLPFPGYTIISKINLTEPNPWSGLFEYLSNEPLLKNKYAILPLESWHMTAINLFTQAEVEQNGENWEAFVTRNEAFFAEVSRILEENPITPQIQYNDLILGSVIQLKCLIDENAFKQIQTLAKQYRCEHLVPNASHITLAYQYQHVHKYEFDAIAQTLKQAFQSHLGEQTISLTPEKLCYFSDMTDFRPWQSLHRQASYPENFLNESRKNGSSDQDEADPKCNIL